MLRMILLLCLLFNTACSSLELSDLATAGGAGAGVLVGSVIYPEPAFLVASAVTGGLAAGSLVETDKSLNAEQIAQVENPWQALLVAFDQLLANAFELVIAGSIAIIGIPMLFSYLLGRMKQRPEDAKAISKLVEKVGKMKE